MRLESKIREHYGFTTDYVRKEIQDWVRCQLAVSGRRRSRKTKLSLPRMRPRRGGADSSVTVILVRGTEFS